MCAIFIRLDQWKKKLNESMSISIFEQQWAQMEDNIKCANFIIYLTHFLTYKL
jgi:hypothetical protein